MDCPPPNWNEGLDPELTKELQLISQFHNLFQHMSFAITDFIYVRKFKTEINIVLTVSPIRYRKYGYHGSQLSKATLLLAIDQLIHQTSDIIPQPSAIPRLHYFPAYELVQDELRDYRFYKEDMLHPSEQAVEYIWERLVDWCFSPAAKEFLKEWTPLKAALSHSPFDADSEKYRAFMDKTMLKVAELQKKYPTFAL